MPAATWPSMRLPCVPCALQARYAATISNTDDMRKRMGVSTAEYGSILTAGFWSYAVWTAINGHWLDASASLSQPRTARCRL